MVEDKGARARAGEVGEPIARKAAPRKGARAAAQTPRAGGARAKQPSSGVDGLRKDLRDFAVARPDGWGHDDWLRFLEHLEQRGHNIADRDAIGSLLERERLALALERIPGVGPRRVQSIADRYGYLWRLRETSAEQLSREANVPRAIAVRVLEAIHG